MAETPPADSDGTARTVSQALRQAGEALGEGDTVRPTSGPDATVRSQPRSEAPPAAGVGGYPARYQVLRELARGGMGRVLVAYDAELRREVAIKELLLDDPELRARFEREALMTARLQHPSIVSVYERGARADGLPYYVMRQVPGRPLDELLAARPTPRERLELLPNLIATAEALAYAHEQRVIHRDLKPGNVLVGRFGETVVIDWGLAKQLGEAEPARSAAAPDQAGGLTLAGAVMGTPAYMPPEQARGEEVDARADVYALGAMLRHLLAGAPPFAGDSAQDLLRQVLAGPPPPLDAERLGAPADLVDIAHKATAFRKEDRYPSAAELAADLGRFRAGQLVGAHRYSRGELLGRWLHRHRAPLSVAGLGLVLLAVTAGVSAVRVVRAQRAAQATSLALLEEEGRQALLLGEPRRALPYLAEAYRAHPESPALRLLVARATRALDAERAVLAPAAGPPALSPDGARVAAGGPDHALRAWDAATGRLLWQAPGHTGPLWAVSFSPDGRRVLTASKDGTARLWDAASGAPLGTCAGHAGPVVDARFDEAGARIITASEDGTARLWGPDCRPAGTLPAGEGSLEACGFDHGRAWALAATGPLHLWDAASQRALPTLPGSPWRMRPAFSPDGARVLTAGPDHAVIVWSAADGRELGRLSGHTDAVRSAAFSADGARVLTAAEDTTARLWDAARFAELRRYVGHRGDVYAAAFSPSSREVATASEDGTARLWDLEGAHLLATFEGHRAMVYLAAFTPDGHRLLTFSNDGTARLWDVDRAAPGRKLEAGAPLNTACFARGGAALVGVPRQGHRALVWDLAGGRPERSVDVGEGAALLGLAPEALRALAVVRGGKASLWDLATGARLWELDPGEVVGEGDLSPDGSRLVLLGAGAPRLWDAAGPRALAGLEYPSPAREAEFLLDGGRRLVTLHEDGTAQAWDAATGRHLFELRHPGAEVSGVAGSADGRLLASGDRQGGVRLWDGEGRPLGELRGHTRTVASLAFSPDGSRLVTGGADNTAKLWDLASRSLAASLDGHTDDVVDVGFSPDGALVLTGGLDGTARLWDARTGAPLAVLSGHGRAVRSAAFSPDGTLALTASLDGAVRLWDLTPERRSPAEIDRLVRERLPFHLEGGRLVSAPPASAARPE